MAFAIIAAHQQDQREMLRRRMFGRHTVPRLIREKTRPLILFREKDLIKRYRFPPEQCMRFFEMARDSMAPNTQGGLSLETRVMSALYYYAQGSHFTVVGDAHGISRWSVSRSVMDFANVLCDVAAEYISFPLDNESLHKIMQGFYQVAGFPCVIGAVDGSFVPIRCPSGQDEYLYVCRKGYHAMNCQGICDSEMLFLNLVAKWPGSTADAHIFNNSSVCEMLITGQIPEGWLLGDSAYGNTKYLLTPLLNPVTRAEERYTRSHKKTRSIIERAFGMWKCRFLCLHKYAGQILLAPRKAVKVILATAVLHNIAMKLNVPILDEDGNEAVIHDEPHGPLRIPAEVNLQNQPGLQDTEDGDEIRRRLVANIFTQP